MGSDVEKKPRLRRLRRIPIKQVVIKKRKKYYKAKKKYYTDDTVDYYDWVPLDKDLPEPFELVKILYEDERVRICWWTGSRWDSGRSIKDVKIIAWKRYKQILTRTDAIQI